MANTKRKKFACKHCDYETNSKESFKVHIAVCLNIPKAHTEELASL